MAEAEDLETFAAFPESRRAETEELDCRTGRDIAEPILVGGLNPVGVEAGRWAALESELRHPSPCHSHRSAAVEVDSPKMSGYAAPAVEAPPGGIPQASKRLVAVAAGWDCRRDPNLRRPIGQFLLSPTLSTQLAWAVAV
jgi:hypothetical protein